MSKFIRNLGQGVRVPDIHEHVHEHCKPYLPGIYLLKVYNRNTRTRCEISSKLTIKTPERRYDMETSPSPLICIANHIVINHIVLIRTIKFNVKQVMQKPVKVCITWKVVGFWEFYIFPGYENVNMLLLILFTVDALS